MITPDWSFHQQFVSLPTWNKLYISPIANIYVKRRWHSYSRQSYKLRELLFVLIYILFLSVLSPGQTDLQFVASWKLRSTCDSVWQGLACTCVDLRSLWSRSNLHSSQCKFFSVWPLNASIFASSTCDYLRVRLTRALKWNNTERDKFLSNNGRAWNCGWMPFNELWNDPRYSTEFSLLGSDRLQIAKPAREH